ncbi:putative peptidase/amidohydrolase [Agromyces rhizosphaerae]|uniref:Peptidase M20 domain-containing protein 2 n=1 Tax=Agromyces rhizosphaerae TaxID=88374 RepID=A0A9W6CWE1_9MICO|nr:M20 family metallopeptidase [Agromyces rhizosphaerae]GLI27276.1 putative peptidase/amidohydrolase [Agromyces rhizosphaerae]
MQTQTIDAEQVDRTTDPNIDDLKSRAGAGIAAAEGTILDLSHRIHAHPEVAWEEHYAAASVADVLEAAGFRTTRGAYGVETAVEAIAGSGDLVIAICSEYDALPGIGHACGHNIIASSGVGAALALAPLADELGITVKLLGTPAEETGGGKVELLKAGAFEGVGAMLIMHPSSGPDLGSAGISTTAIGRFEVVFTGVEGHAGGGPQHSRNALSAATVMLTAVGMLRQHLPTGATVNAIVTEGGTVSNVVPARAVVQVEARAYDLAEWRDLVQRVLKCAEGAAIATGCGWAHELVGNPYAPYNPDTDLCARSDANLARTGRQPMQVKFPGGGSSDLGNVSQVIPTTNVLVSVLDTPGMAHHPEWTEHTAGAQADRTTLDAAKVLAWTAIDAAADPELRARLVAEAEQREPGATRAATLDPTAE